MALARGLASLGVTAIFEPLEEGRKSYIDLSLNPMVWYATTMEEARRNGAHSLSEREVAGLGRDLL